MQLDSKTCEGLKAILGDDHLILDANECRLFSQDVFKESDHTTLAIMQPKNKQELAKAVGLAVDAGYALFPRGGGMSYTGGYLPTEAKAISVDFSKMGRVLEINKEDMFVTVEAGCRWVDLHEALKGSGLRTPYWGTLSGIHATIGGSVSQNSIFFGSGLHGTAADSVIGFDVVIADGSTVTTGAGAQINSSPFQRHYGPDLTGLFTCDAGALGLKAHITLRLITDPTFHQFTSFSFPDFAAMFVAASEVSRRGLASECFGFDPYLQSQRMKRESLAKDIKVLGNVMKSSGSALGAIKDAAKLALAGRGYMDDVPFSYHFMIENHSEIGAKEALKAVNEICSNAGGTKIENSIPKIVRSNPFMPLNNMVGPNGERWVPVHALVPHSKATSMMQAIEDLFESHRGEMEEYGIETGYLFATVGSSTSVLEPVFFWPDALMDIQKRTVEASVQKNFIDFGERLDGRATVTKIRSALTKVMMGHGAVHLQIGKAYRYSEGLDPATLALVKSLKATLDPAERINPGALGLF